MSMVGEVFLVKNDTILQRMPSIFLNHMSTWDVSKLYHWQVEHPHRSRIEQRITCFATMVCLSYCLFSSYGYLLELEKFYKV